MEKEIAEKIFKRGFITKEESDNIDLDKLAVKVTLKDADGGEGIWIALLTEKERNLYYNDDSEGDEIKGILLNNAICYLPHRTWGRVIFGKTSGDEIPIFLAEEQIELFKKTDKEYIEHYEGERKCEN